jgi:hypothetical protein
VAQDRVRNKERGGRATESASARLDIGAVILDQISPGTGAITPLAGQLVTSKYDRGEEYAADAHRVVLLRRAGYPKEMEPLPYRGGAETALAPDSSDQGCHPRSR